MSVANNLTGKTLNKRYEILRPLGKGGMGKVYLAKDIRFGKQVVIKVPTMEVGDKEFKARFMREIASLANLEHPHIVSTLDWGEIEGIPFLVLRYLGGGSLRDRITDSQGLKKSMPLEGLNQWLPQIASALDFIHSKKWVHRDLKPDNILFDEIGNPYLADFGIAKALEGASMGVKTTLGTAVGTPEYMAPEMHLCKGIGAKADQFGLAVLVYESLAGILPFKGLMLTDLFLDVMRGKPKLIHELVPAIPLQKSNALMKGLAKDQDKRHDNCGLFASEVTGIKLGIGQLFQGYGEGSIFGQIEPLQMKPPIKTGFPAIPDEAPSSMPELAVTKVTRNGVIPFSEIPAKVEEAVILPELASTRVIREGVKPLSSQMPLKVEEAPSIPELAFTRVIRKGVPPLSSQIPLKVEEDEPYIQNREKNRVSLRIVLWAGGIMMLVTALVLVTLVVRSSGEKKAAAAKKIEDDRKAAAAADKAAADKAAADKAAADKAAADKAAADKAAADKAAADTAAAANLLKAPFTKTKAEEFQKSVAKSLKKGVVEKANLGNGVSLDMVLIPAGKFEMGSPVNEQPRGDNETQHEVTLTNPFYMGKYEVTQEQWEAVMGRGNNLSNAKGEKLPVTNVSWDDCQNFIKKLNAKTNGRYRLPTEAEWEYACRAGTITAYSFGNAILPKDANISESGFGKPVEGWIYPANAFGLHNMHGNVREWCEDWSWAYPENAVTDPTGPKNGGARILRSGSFFSKTDNAYARSAFRNGAPPFTRVPANGFRLVMDP
jgi:formylglycine-generating enzyme required for sulfatase activity/serine/threonine protein kinase